jgi:hypothetical protein
MSASRKKPAASNARKVTRVNPPTLELLATVAARLWKPESGTKEAVSRAWGLISESERYLREEIPKKIREEKVRSSKERERVLKEFVAAIKEITSQTKKGRALDYFKQFLAGKTSKKGVKLEKREGFRSFAEYFRDGIEKPDVNRLKLRYQQAFPVRKRNETVREMPKRIIDISDE